MPGGSLGSLRRWAPPGSRSAADGSAARARSPLAAAGGFAGSSARCRPARARGVPRVRQDRRIAIEDLAVSGLQLFLPSSMPRASSTPGKPSARLSARPVRPAVPPPSLTPIPAPPPHPPLIPPPPHLLL